MAQILLQVEDPLGVREGSGRLPLLLNSYVSLDIFGSRIPKVIVLPRKVVKEGNRIWIFEAGKLRIRTIHPVWEDNDNLYVQSGLQSGEMIVTSEMSIVVDGMAVRLVGVEPQGSTNGEGRKTAAERRGGSSRKE